MPLGLQPTGTDPLIQKILAQGEQGQKDYAQTSADLEASRQRETAARTAQQEALAPVGSQIKDAVAKVPQMGELAPIPDAPKAPTIDAKEMGDTLALITGLAALGGALTRQPLTAALNNFSAGVHGYVQGNQQVFQDNIKQFESNLKQASAKNEEIYKKYEAADKKYGADINALQAQYKLIAAETQNPIDIELAARGDIVSLAELKAKSQQQYTTALGSVARMKEAAEARREASADRRAIAEMSAGTKGWQVFQMPDGTLMRVNSATGETAPIEGSKGATKPGTAGKGGAAAGGVRGSLVQAASKNALARLDEIKGSSGQFPTTSAMFGQHGTGAVSRMIHGVGQAALSNEQQKVDADYASLVDEAIPVFTGGLRGSDAFRQFLMGQLPGPGDSQETANEKMRLFEANIKGTANTFGAVYSTNPAFQAPGGAPATVPTTPADDELINKYLPK